MTRRIFVVGVHGKCELVNAEAVRISQGWQRLIADVKADEVRQRREFEKRMLRPALPRIAS